MRRLAAPIALSLLISLVPLGTPRSAATTLDQSTPGKATGGGFVPQGTQGGGGTLAALDATDTLDQLAELLVTVGSDPASVGGKATFGFVARCCPESGNLELNDHGLGVRIKTTSITAFVISDAVCPSGIAADRRAHFQGEANETTAGGTAPVLFFVDVDDCGEPGSSPGAGPDTLFISTTSGYSAGEFLVGGNIQVRR